MSDSSTEEFLEHFGVKGMKWGRRKSESSDGGSTSSTRSRVSEVGKKVAIGATVAAAGVGAAYAGKFLKAYGPEIIGTVKLASHAVQYKDGLSYANSLLAGPSALKTVSRGLNGVYKVSKL